MHIALVSRGSWCRSPQHLHQDGSAEEVAAVDEKKPDPVVAAVEDKQEVSSEVAPVMPENILQQ